MAHELGHIVGGHAIGIDNGFKKAGKITCFRCSSASRRASLAPEMRPWA